MAGALYLNIQAWVRARNIVSGAADRKIYTVDIDPGLTIVVSSSADHSQRMGKAEEFFLVRLVHNVCPGACIAQLRLLASYCASWLMMAGQVVRLIRC